MRVRINNGLIFVSTTATVVALLLGAASPVYALKRVTNVLGWKKPTPSNVRPTPGVQHGSSLNTEAGDVVPHVNESNGEKLGSEIELVNVGEQRKQAKILLSDFEQGMKTLSEKDVSPLVLSRLTVNELVRLLATSSSLYGIVKQYLSAARNRVAIQSYEDKKVVVDSNPLYRTDAESLSEFRMWERNWKAKIPQETQGHPETVSLKDEKGRLTREFVSGWLELDSNNQKKYLSIASPSVKQLLSEQIGWVPDTTVIAGRPKSMHVLYHPQTKTLTQILSLEDGSMGVGSSFQEVQNPKLVFMPQRGNENYYLFSDRFRFVHYVVYEDADKSRLWLGRLGAFDEDIGKLKENLRENLTPEALNRIEQPGRLELKLSNLSRPKTAHSNLLVNATKNGENGLHDRLYIYESTDKERAWEIKTYQKYYSKYTRLDTDFTDLNQYHSLQKLSPRVLSELKWLESGPSELLALQKRVSELEQKGKEQGSKLITQAKTIEVLQNQLETMQKLVEGLVSHTGYKPPGKEK